MSTQSMARLARAPGAALMAITLLSAMAIVPAMAADAAAGNFGKPMSEDDKTLYALGWLLSRNVQSFQLSSAELKMVEAGLNDAINRRSPSVDIDTYGPKVQALQQMRLAVLTQHEKQAGQAYLQAAAATPGAQKTPTGIVYIPLTAGKGASPERTDQVTVHYEGKLIDGTVFDSSIKRGQPATFNLGAVIPCWTEALQLMKVGGKSRFVCPAILAYGERGAPPIINPGATLVFEVELLNIAPRAAAGPAPAGAAPGGAAPGASAPGQPASGNPAPN
jgi:FKBP-type peptidyl-prolyl cis-trans isomerase FkpA/FKBP-type peptidyl-prolyl cis-trans isomerase FklB